MAAWGITGELVRGVTVLVVFCPCSLVLATPTAVAAAIGNASRLGFIVRAGDALECLAKVSFMCFDKTGTLTHGHPEVINVISFGDLSETELVTLAASAEQRSEHPLGRAIVRYAGERALLTAEDFEMTPGRGLTVRIENAEIAVGNRAYLETLGVNVPPYESEGATVIYLARERQCLGVFSLADTLRQEAPAMVAALQAQGIALCLMTGDNAATAARVAKAVGIETVRAECLPEDKYQAILTAQQAHRSVAMIGDGINDAPALRAADVGIAMAKEGCELTVEAADVATLQDSVNGIPHLVALSRRMLQVIRRNILLSMSINFLAIGLAIGGFLNPVWGALVHNAGSFIVILLSASLLRWHYPKKP